MDMPVALLLSAIAPPGRGDPSDPHPSGSLEVSAVLLGPQARRYAANSAWWGRPSALVVALLVGITAIYALGRV
jgi:hypothetical protein